AAGGVRRIGVGGVGGSIPRVGRILSLLERDLWAAEMGTADFVSVYLATFLQRSAVDCQRMHRAGGLRRLLLAEPGNGLRGAHFGPAHPGSRAASGELDRHARNLAGDIHL